MTKTTTKKEKVVKEVNLETSVIDTKGKESGKIKLPEDVFGLPWNADLVHQVVTSMMSNARQPIAHAKMRGEVSGGGKKPWRQKGTGRARHGSSRSPIWVGGGTTHGPRNDKNYDRKVNKKMKTKALYTILSKKFKDGEVVFVESLSIDTPKTAKAMEFVNALGKVKGLEKFAGKKNNAALVGIDAKNPNLVKSFRNIGKISFDEVRNWNPALLMNYKYVIIVNPESSLKILSGKKD